VTPMASGEERRDGGNPVLTRSTNRLLGGGHATCRARVAIVFATHSILWLCCSFLSLIYFGSTTTSSLGRASRVALSIPRWAITSSGGVCVSHSESDKS